MRALRTNLRLTRLSDPARRAFSAQHLNAELDRETRKFLSEPRNSRLDFAKRVVYLSSIFDWYRKDFLQWLVAAEGEIDPTLLDYVRRYLSLAKRTRLDQCKDCALEFIVYDWQLNAE